MVNKITAEDLINKGVIGLPDVPGLTTIEMQKKLDEISRDVIIPRFNELIDNTVSASDEFSKLNTYNVGDYCIYQSVLYKCTTAITTAGEWDATKWKATAIDKELKEISSTPENKDAISDKYDSSKTYAVGDYCIYNDTLYKCKTQITSAEEFDSSKWEPTNCGKEFEVLNSNLKKDYESVGTFTELSVGSYTFESDGYISWNLYASGHGFSAAFNTKMGIAQSYDGTQNTGAVFALKGMTLTVNTKTGGDLRFYPIIYKK